MINVCTCICLYDFYVVIYTCLVLQQAAAASFGAADEVDVVSIHPTDASFGAADDSSRLAQSHSPGTCALHVL